MTEFAIVGLGSWGLSVLERTVSRTRAIGEPVTVHVIEPGSPGGGVYNVHQPDYLVLNNACGQLSLYAPPEMETPTPPYAVGLLEWAVSRGYSWHGYECITEPGGRPLRPTDYLPRRVMGEYLRWFYEVLIANAPNNLSIVRHETAAVDIVSELGGKERIHLGDGTSVLVDHVILTSGHTWNDEPAAGGVSYRRPYPVEYFDQITPPGSPIAIAGLGLVGFDMLAALTVGRGGAFEEIGHRMRYHRSGKEPTIYYYSRTGMPCCAKSATGVDATGTYDPIVCTDEMFENLSGRTRGRGRQRVDFRRDLLPRLFDEMKARYLRVSALKEHGENASVEVARKLREAWLAGEYDKAVTALEETYGRFEPAEHLFAGLGRTYVSSHEYESHVYDMIEQDLDEALMPGGSPVKAAQEVLRILRDQLRGVIEFGGLTLDSYADFQKNIRGRINRLEAGPPPLRSQQMLALMDAGVVRVPFGPSPRLTLGADGQVTVHSSQLDQPFADSVETVVRGHLDLPSLPRSESPLLKRLYRTGRLTQLHYGETPVGSVAISEDFHPYDDEGRLQPNLSLLGVLTEGVRYFTHYLPSPRSRRRAVQDAEFCVETIVG